MKRKLSMEIIKKIDDITAQLLQSFRDDRDDDVDVDENAPRLLSKLKVVYI